MSKTTRSPILLLFFAAVASAALFGVFGLTGEASAESDADASVNVAHFAPFAADLNGTSVSVLVNGALAIPNFVFGETETGIPLAAGSYTIEIIAHRHEHGRHQRHVRPDGRRGLHAGRHRRGQRLCRWS